MRGKALSVQVIQQDGWFRLTIPSTDPVGRPTYEYVEGKTWSRNLASQALDLITESYGITRRNVRLVHVTM